MTSAQFAEAYKKGFFFIPKYTILTIDIPRSQAQNITTSLTTTTFPTIDQIVSSTTYMTGCVAFMIDQSGYVTYIYQLFDYDIGPIQPGTNVNLNPAVGIYISNIDRFYDLLPNKNYLSSFRRYKENNIDIPGPSLDENNNFSPMDGGWSRMQFNGFLKIAPQMDCPNRNTYKCLSNQDGNGPDVIFKTRRVGISEKNRYEIYVTSSDNTFNDTWKTLLRKCRTEGGSEVYYGITAEAIMKDKNNIDANGFFYPTEQYGDTTNNIKLRSDYVVLDIETNRRYFRYWRDGDGNDNMCRLTTNYNGMVNDSRNAYLECMNGQDTRFILYQPSISWILAKKFDDWNIGSNLCLMLYSDSSLLSSHKLTDAFIRILLSSKGKNCLSVIQEFCASGSTGTNFSTDTCKTFCSTNDCSNSLKTYCSSTGADQTICGCFINSAKTKPKYDKFFENVNRPKLTSCDKRYSFPLCANSPYKYNDETNTRLAYCSDYRLDCVKNLTLKSDGSIDQDSLDNYNNCIVTNLPTLPPPAPAPPAPTSSSGLSTAAKIGIGVGAGVFGLLIILAIIYKVRKNRRDSYE
jgi:hypothetical protein